ncbi:MAG: cytochrome c [Coriobacteriia bacterium]|nr:cytochrome c [Coriobacteriia bacterium]
MKRFALVALMLVVLALAAACGSSEEPAVEVEPTPGEATGLDGATILQEKCTGCHDLERVNAEDLDAVGWAAVIDDMIARGADVSEDEAAALAEYLSLQ